MLFEELWGENNVKTISVKMSEPTGLKMAHIIRNGGIPKLKEYVVLAKPDGLKNIHIEKIAKADWDDEYKTIIITLSEDEIANAKEIRDNEQRTSTDIKKCDEILSKIKTKSLGDYFKDENIKDKKAMADFKFENAWRIIQVVSMAGGAKHLADKKKKNNKNDFFSIITPQNKMYFIKNKYDRNKEIPRIKVLFADDYLTVNPGDFWQDIKTTGLDNEGGVDFKNGKKPIALIERIVKSVNNPNAIVLDFFAGSGTTAEVVMRLNEKDKDKGKRQAILITDNNEVVNGKKHKIMTDICYPRVENTIKGFKNKKGIGNSIRYFRTSFVGKNNILKADDADKIELAHNAGGMLAIAENTFDQVEQTDYWQIFENPKQYMAVYFREEFGKFDDFIEKIKKLKKPVVVYIFSWEKEFDFDDFEDNKNIKVKTIPQPILEIYKQIYNLV
jgi:adenine-specific DNA-methyltransferase